MHSSSKLLDLLLLLLVVLLLLSTLPPQALQLLQKTFLQLLIPSPSSLHLLHPDRRHDSQPHRPQRNRFLPLSFPYTASVWCYTHVLQEANIGFVATDESAY